MEDHNGAKRYEVRRLDCNPIMQAISTLEMVFSVDSARQPTSSGDFTTYLRKKFHDLGITEVSGVPPTLFRLVHQPVAGALLQSLRMTFHGRTALPLQLGKQILELFMVKPGLSRFTA